MSFQGDDYGKRALDFVEGLQRLESYEEICAYISKELEWFGFTAVSSWSMPSPERAPEGCVILNTRPLDYVENYIRKDYVHRDPVVTELFASLKPFSWTDVREHRSLTKEERNIIDEAREFGATDGFIVPIVSYSGSLAVFSPCGRDPDLSMRARAAVELVGLYSYHALQRSLVRHRRESVVHSPLTPREKEIVSWVAMGKTDDEIGEILSISATTVITHLNRAKRKLDAFSRTYMVVQALRFGEIAI